MSEGSSSTASSRKNVKQCSPARPVKRPTTTLKKALTSRRTTKPKAPQAKAPKSSQEVFEECCDSPENTQAPQLGQWPEFATPEAQESSTGSTDYLSVNESPKHFPEPPKTSPRTRRGSEGDLHPSTSTPEHRGVVEVTERPRSESSLLRIKAQIRAASAVDVETSIRATEEPRDPEGGSDSFMSDISAIGGGALHDMPRLANALLQKTKSKIEESRNLNREIREAAISGIHGLHEMILRLADSRNRHIAEKEKLKAGYERRISHLETKHAAALESLLGSHRESHRDILDAVKTVRKETEAVRWLSLDIEKHIKENAKTTSGLADKLTGSADGACSREINTIQEDIAMLRLELGTLNMAAYGSAERPCGMVDHATSAAVQGIREEMGKLREEVSGALASDNLQRPDGSRGLFTGVPVSVPHQHPRRTYASALNTPKHGVMIESIEPQHTSDDVLKLVKDSVDVIKMGIGINKVAKISKQRVIINCDTVRDRDELQKAIKEHSSRITVSETRPKKPLLRLMGVISDLNSTKIEEAILSQNKTLLGEVRDDEKYVRVIRRIKGRTNLLNNIVLETSPTLWQKLVSNKVRIGYQVVNAVDQSPLVQCFNCLGFGYRASECRKTGSAGNHETRKCEARGPPPLCANCMA